MDYLVRFVQLHESFRKAELEALADLYGINIEFLHYDQYVRYYMFACLLFPNLAPPMKPCSYRWVEIDFTSRLPIVSSACRMRMQLARSPLEVS